MGETSEDITPTSTVVSNGALERSPSTLGAIFTSWNITIQDPARAMIDSMPASRDQASTSPDTRAARRCRRLASEVLCGHHLPPRYCHISHKTSDIAGMAQGIAGLNLRFPTRSAPQIPWPNPTMRKTRTADQATITTLPGRERILTCLLKGPTIFQVWPCERSATETNLRDVGNSRLTRAQ